MKCERRNERVIGRGLLVVGFLGFYRSDNVPTCKMSSYRQRLPQTWPPKPGKRFVC